MNSELLSDPENYRGHYVELDRLEWSGWLEPEIGQEVEQSHWNRRVPEEMLADYRSLWVDWCAAVDGPTAIVPALGGEEREILKDEVYYEHYRIYVEFRMYHPKYLRDVVRHHLWLTEGLGDVMPSREIIDRVARALQEDPDLRAEYERKTAGPWRRAEMGQGLYGYLWNADGWEELVARRRPLRDPYSTASLERAALIQQIDSGTASIEIYNEDGDLVARRDPPDEPGPWAAGSN